MPETNLDIDFILWVEKPINRDALARTLLIGKVRVLERLRDEGDDWLTAEDDPFEVSMPERCYLRIDSAKASDGRRLMTYQTLWNVFQGLWEVLFLGKEEKEGSLRIKVANIIAGHGAISAKEIKRSPAIQNHREASVKYNVER